MSPTVRKLLLVAAIAIVALAVAAAFRSGSDDGNKKKRYSCQNGICVAGDARGKYESLDACQMECKPEILWNGQSLLPPHRIANATYSLGFVNEPAAADGKLAQGDIAIMKGREIVTTIVKDNRSGYYRLALQNGNLSLKMKPTIDGVEGEVWSALQYPLPADIEPFLWVAGTGKAELRDSISGMLLWESQ